MHNYEKKRQHIYMDIYIEQQKKIVLRDTSITIGKVCNIICDKEIKEIKKIELNVKNNNKDNKNFCIISSLDIIKAIKNKYPQSNITVLGESSTLVEVLKKPQNKLISYIKVVFITTILFTGCATAIVAFHIESQLSAIFIKYATILNISSDERSMRFFLEIPYAIGISIGIIVFFNHIFGKQVTHDPTPIEVEMNTYEKDVAETLIGNDKQ